MPFNITITDIIDVMLVAFLLFQLYRFIRGTAAFSIFLGIFLIYVTWLIVRVLKMELISALLGQVMGVGIIALIIVFQQEVRRFLLELGNKYITRSQFSFKNIFSSGKENPETLQIAENIVNACESMSSQKTGALIVISKNNNLDVFSKGGEILNARVSAGLLETIFFKNTPLHDGATLIEKNMILAARCPLPSTEQMSIPDNFGMRHRAAIGISEYIDAIAVVVSEETGYITAVIAGKYRYNITPDELKDILLSGNLTQP
jgi:uncharacterized protein (TIGR00159 family)